MSIYRQGTSPPTSTIKLEAVDPQKMFRALMFLIVGSVVPTTVAFMISLWLVPRNLTVLVNMVLLTLMSIGFLLGLRHILTKMNELRFLLEIADTELRLLTPNGDRIADTTAGSLLFTRVNYTRRGRYGSAWLRPGWQMRHPGGEHLIGTLMPELAWENAAHDRRIPEFELMPPPFEQLDACLRRRDDERQRRGDERRGAPPAASNP